MLACRPRQQRAILATAALNSSGGWHEATAQEHQLSAFHPVPRRNPASPRSTLPATIPEQEPAPRMSQQGSATSSSHGSMGELATPPEAELSELEQRKVVVLG